MAIDDLESIYNPKKTPEKPMSVAEPDSYQYTNPIIDPYVSGMMESSLKAGGDMSTFFRPEEYYRGEEERRAGELERGVTAGGEAMMRRGTIEAERAMQRAGKLRSSALVYGEGGLLDVSEAAKLQTQQQLSAGLLDIYGQVGGERIQREQMGAGLLETGMGIAGAERIAGAEIESTEKIANIQATTQVQVANIQRASAEKIAQIQADTTLTGFQKQLEIANINAQTQRDVASINKAAGESVADIYTTSAEVMQAADFNFNTNPATGNPWTWDEFTQSLEQNQLQFDLTREDDMEKFWTNFDEMKRQYNIDDDRIRDLAYREIREQARQFNFSLEENQRQFSQNMQLARKYFASDQEHKQWQRDLAYDTLREQTREFNLTNTEQARQYNKSLEWAKKNAYIDDERMRDLQRNALEEQARQFSVTTTQDWNKFLATLNESARTFDLDFAERQEVTDRALAIQEEKHKTDEIGATIGIIRSILNDPSISSYLQGLEEAGEPISTEFVTQIFNLALDVADPEQLNQDLRQLITDLRKGKLLPEGTAIWSNPETGEEITQAQYDDLPPGKKRKFSKV